MIRETYITVAAAAGLAAACVSISTIAAAGGGGGLGGVVGGQPGHAATVGQQPLTPPPPTPQFNGPGAQIAPSRPGNPANQRASMSLIPPQGWEPSTSGRRASLARKKARPDFGVIEQNQQLDRMLETGICRGC